MPDPVSTTHARGVAAAVITVALSIAAAPVTSQELIITGVVDGPLGGGVPKAVELYVKESVADLSRFGLGSANNGGGTDGEEFTFPAVPATAGQFLYVTSQSAGFETFFGFAADHVSSAASINGDDAIELFASGTVVDVFGEIDVDGSGQPWEYMDGWAYRSAGTGPDGSTFVVASFTFSGPNALDGETTNASAATAFPIGTYTAGGGTDRPPTVESVNPSGADPVAPDTDLEVTFSEPVAVGDAWFTLVCSISGRITATFSGAETAYVIDPAGIGGGETCTLTVLAAWVRDLDGAPDPMAADASFEFTTLGECGDPSTAIYDVQGAGASSPLAGQPVSIEGIVTGDFQDDLGSDGDLNGFYVQDANGDGDPATSDGIFVFEGSDPSLDVMPGDVVRVTGTVAEFFGDTQVSADSTQICASGAAVAPTPVTLPAAASVENADGEPIADLEHVEGMLVVFEQRLSVTELFNLDRFGELRLSSDGRLFQFTNASDPDVGGFAAHLDEIARRNVMLDDGLTVQNPDPIRYPSPGLETANPLRMGDTVAGLTGNIRFSRGAGGSGDEVYRLMPVEEPVFEIGNERPADLEAAGRLRVASVNVLNFFNDLDDGSGQCFPSFSDDDCRGADGIEEFERQRHKLVSALAAIDADILALVELENDYPDGADSSIAGLVEALNASGASGCAGGFDYVDPQARVGDDAIAVGLAYCADTVAPTPGTTVEILVDADLPGLGIDPGDGVFVGNATSRSPLAATFTEIETGQVVTVAVNHFKSKGDSGLDDAGSVCNPDPGADPNCDQGDGQGFWNFRRTLAAEAIAAWLATDPTGSGDPDRLIVGDLNAYLREDPIVALTDDAGYVNLIEAHGQGDEPYSFVFDGQAGALDHALASPGLAAQVTSVVEWHINADEADGIDYNLDFGRNPALFDGTVPYRASDHDPLVVGLDLHESTEHCDRLDGRWWRRDLDRFEFQGVAGESVSVRLRPDPDGHHAGEQATLALQDRIRGVWLWSRDAGPLPARIDAVLPASGRYRIRVHNLGPARHHPRFRGDYCLTVESSTGDAVRTLRPLR